ncbi:hypothetical protein KKI24_27225 [bacterium]|nr:hypothetical protein [bacterium]
MPEEYGCLDNSLSKHLKCYIKQGLVTVIGKLPEGYSKSLQHNWNSPFSDDSPGSVFQKAGAVLQMTTGKTMKGFLNSFLTWEGTEPMQLSIPLFFEAEADPEREVRLAVMHLEAMSSPTFSKEVKNFLKSPSVKGAIELAGSKFDEAAKGEIGNRIPQKISINIGRNVILRNCVIESLEVEDPMIYSSEGLPLQQTCTLNVKTRSTLDTTDIMNSYQ